MMQTMTAEKPDAIDEILTNVCGKAGVITLNRPQSLNALNLSMIQKMTEILQQWKTDPTVEFVVIESSHSKAFCAGGDICEVYTARLRDDYDFCDALFRQEYRLNYLISTYPKPYLSLIDGICMGGGMGISVHGTYRIVTDQTVMAMPETGIGFFPDVGASYFLNQCPGQTGTFLGVVGEKITASDALYTGLATHYIAATQLKILKQSLFKIKTGAELPEVLEKVKMISPIGLLEQNQELIDHCFQGNTVEEIIHRLESATGPLASQWLRILDKRSPTSLKVALKLLRDNRGKSLPECLAIEFYLSQKFSKFYDFFEGIRALLIDKDQSPRWLATHLNRVPEERVKEFFEPLSLKEFKL